VPQIDADTVLALARAQGQHWIDTTAAERIAAGATAAIAAVSETLRSAEPGLLTTDGATFLDVLESLADPPQ
jgi:hypothetical protein